MSTIMELQELLRHFFMDDGIRIHDQTVASDIMGWDSLANISLMVAIEKHFSIKLTSREIEKFKNIGDIVFVIESRPSEESLIRR